MAPKYLSFIATSLDGFIAGVDHELDWLEPAFFAPGLDEKLSHEDGDCGYGDFISKVDTLLMGSATFKAVSGFEPWPYSLPVYVASQTLKEVPATLEGKASILNGSPSELGRQLEERGCKSVYVDGGRLIRSFIAERMLDEITLSVIPVLLGNGIRLFETESQRTRLEVMHSRTFNNGIVQTAYQINYP